MAEPFFKYDLKIYGSEPFLKSTGPGSNFNLFMTMNYGMVSSGWRSHILFENLRTAFPRLRPDDVVEISMKIKEPPVVLNWKPWVPRWAQKSLLWFWENVHVRK